MRGYLWAAVDEPAGALACARLAFQHRQAQTGPHSAPRVSAPRASKRRGPLNRPHCMCVVTRAGRARRGCCGSCLGWYHPDRQAGDTARHPARCAGARAYTPLGSCSSWGGVRSLACFPAICGYPQCARPSITPTTTAGANQAAKPISTHHHRLIPTPNGTSRPRTWAVPSTHHTTSHASALRPARYRPARYGVTTLTARGRPARQRSAHS